MNHQRGGLNQNDTYNAQRTVAQSRATAQQLEASGAFQDAWPGKGSLLELLAAAREVRDWSLCDAHIGLLPNLAPGVGCNGEQSVYSK